MIKYSGITKIWFAAAWVLASIHFADIACAELKIFAKEYTYQASELDSKATCRVIALEQAKRLLLEELGMYLESKTEVKNSELTLDQISTLTAGIVSAEIVSEKWDGRTYVLKAKIEANPDEVAISVDALRKDVQKRKDLESTITQLNKALIELDTLKNKQKAKKNKKNAVDYAKYVNKIEAIKWYQKGCQLFSKNNKDAVKAFDKALKLYPEYEDALYSRGILFSSVDKNKAMNDFNTILEINHNSAKGYMARARLYYVHDDYNNALNDYSMVIKIRPDEWFNYSNRGNVYYAQHNYSKAIDDYTTAIKLMPKYADNYRLRGKCYLELEQYQLAVNDFDSALSIDPMNSNIYSYRGEAHRGLKKYSEALNDYDKAIKINPKDSALYQDRGATYMLLGNNEQAINDYNYAVKLSPNDASILWIRGYTYEIIGNTKLALDDYNKCLELKPNSLPSIYKQRGVVKAKLKMIQEAIEDFKIAAKLGDEKARGLLQQFEVDWK